MVPNRPVAGFDVPKRPPPVVAVLLPNPVAAGWVVPNGEAVAAPPNKFEPVPVLVVPKPVFVVVFPNDPKPVPDPKAPAWLLALPCFGLVRSL